MKNPNLSQLLLLLNNEKDRYVYQVIDEEEFLFVFLTHITEHFQKRNHVFQILEPLLDPSIEKEQQTVLAINHVEVGELHLLYNSFFNESSLVYYSPSGLMELHLVEFDDYKVIKLSEYILLLHEFCALLLGEKELYEKFKSNMLE